MGVLNVTPDSFSDGGSYLDSNKAIDHAYKLLHDGSDILDIGAESSRPGADLISSKEEISRLLPVLKELSKSAYPISISINTWKSKVAQTAIDYGALIINDISALRWDAKMPKVVASSNASLIIMHTPAIPKNMQQLAYYQNVARTIKLFMEERITYASSCGIKKDKITIDPGIGFGKTTVHNIEILRNLSIFSDLEVPILIGLSRKQFLRAISTNKKPKISDLDFYTAIVNVFAWLNGASILRVHNVAKAKESVTIWKELYYKR